MAVVHASGLERRSLRDFGQLQSGISSVFGLRDHLSKTIPKHGHTCRIDVKPSQLGRSAPA